MEMETTTTQSATCTAEASASAAPATTTATAAAGPLPVTSHELQLPPGFRFHPTDEELVVHYLTRKLASHSFKPIPIVTEVDLYKFDPWELPQQAAFGEKEWYFFSPRDRKYPNGVRPNRAAASGYWKATGTDKIIYSSTDGRKIGVKKALVFYKGRAPKGVKSNWIMHEYRLVDASNKALSVRKKGSLRLDDWVLCRIYKKKAKAHNRASTKSENTRKNNQSFEEDILAALPEIDEAKLSSFPQLGGSMNKIMDQNDSFMQVLLAGGHDGRALSMNQFSALDLLQRNRQTPTTEMLFPTTTTMSKDGIWQFGGIIDQRKEDMSPSQQSTSLALLDSLRQQHHAGRAAGLIHDDFQRDFRSQHLAFAGSQQQQHHEVVDESFTRNTPILFPPAAHLNFNNSFSLHSGAY